MLEIRLCGGLEVVRDGEAVSDAPLAGKQGRLAFAYLVTNRHRVVGRDELAELLWADRLPESWSASLTTIISRVRKQLTEAGLDGAAALANTGDGYQLALPPETSVDWEVALAAIDDAENALARRDHVAAIDAAAAAARPAVKGFLADSCAWVDRQRSATQDVCVRAALVTAEAHLANGAAARAADAARDALAIDELREAGYRLLMRALDAAGERAQALRTWERCRVLLADELGVDPSPETEAVYLDILGAPSDAPATAAEPSLPSGVVTFLLTDIVESSALWEKQPTAMATTLERHDALVAHVVASAGGTMLKSKLEGDATVSVFARATAGALAAIALRTAIADEAWPEGAAPTVRMALHTGEAFERAGDYFGPALNRAARVRGLAGAGQILLTQAIAELVRDHLPEDAALVDLGHHELRGLSRGENLFEVVAAADAPLLEAAPLEQPALPAPLATAGPFVGRGDELSGLWSRWSAIAESGGAHSMLIAGEPGVGKSRLAAECSRLAHADGGIVLYGRCDEELGAALQPFVEAIRGLTPALGRDRLRRVRGINELGRLVPEISEQVPGAAGASSADPDTERQALFDAITELLVVASKDAPLLLVLDDLHWAGKTTLALLRHLLRNAGDARLFVIGTYRDTELSRTHPLAATIADLRRDRAADRVALEGLDPGEVAAYLAAIGNHDVALSRELAEVTSGNPFFLIEVLRHVEESGGVWETGSLPEGVREATGRRLSHLSDAANDALSVAAVAGTTFQLNLIERVRNADLVEEISEAVRAGLVFEDSSTLGTFRFAHALVRQVLLAELVTLKRLRLHHAIAELLEADDDGSEARLADLAHHWFECASAGNAAKAVDACRRAADYAMERLAYEEAGDLYRMAIEAAESIDAVDDAAAIHLARCDVLVTAGDVPAARAAIEALRVAVRGDARLAAWHTTYAGQLAVLADTEALPRIVESIAVAAKTLHDAGDTNGEAKAHYVHALALERLGQIGAAERALVSAIDAARTAGDQKLADAILAETPPVVLWGPIPVTRASGRCLDVVRVLRITSGAPAVESVALRCQAVLEALRGRIDAARRMIASAHRKVDEVGLVLRRLETETSAGFIELLAGDAAEAERILSAAYAELRARSLDSEAALAAALLGRALLSLHREDEAEVMAKEAESLAGADLYPAVIWRDVRALAAVGRGELQLARELAEQSVALVSSTDALLMVVDARRTLATVLRAAGDTAGANAQDRLAIEAANAKGATVLAERIGAVASAPASADVAAATRSPWTNAAFRALDDRTVDLVATRGQQLALVRGNASLMLVEADEGGSIRTTVEFGFDAVDDAYAHLDERFRAQAPLHERLLLWQSINERDWETFSDILTPDVVFVDHRPLALGLATGRDDVAAIPKSLADIAPDVHSTINHLQYEELPDGTLVAILQSRSAGTSGGGGLFDVPTVPVIQCDSETRITNLELFAPDDLEGARQRYDEFVAAATASTPEAKWGNTAWQTEERIRAAWARRDWETVVAIAGPTDDRTGGAHLRMDLDSVIDGMELAFGMGSELHLDLVATRGEHLALVRLRLTGSNDDGGDFEAVFLTVVEVDAAGDHVRSILFDDNAVFDAMKELDERFIAQDERNRQDLMPQAYNDRDWDAFVASAAEDMKIADNRSSRLVNARNREELLATYKANAELAPDSRLVIDHVRHVRADDGSVAIIGSMRLLGTNEGGPFENASLLVFNGDSQLRATVMEYFDPDDFGGAEARYRQLAESLATATPEARWGNAAWRAMDSFQRACRSHDWDAATGAMPLFFDDRSSGAGVTVESATIVASLKSIFENGASMTGSLVATRGERLAVTRCLFHGSSGLADSGTFDSDFLIVVETDDAGDFATVVLFDGAALEAAHAYIDDRFLVEIPARAQVVESFNERDWRGFAATFRDDVTLTDHRTSRLSSVKGRAALVRQYQMSTELAPDARMVRDHVRYARRADGLHALLVSMSMVGTVDGGAFDNAGLLVSVFDAAEQIVTIDTFSPDVYDEAKALYDELCRQDEPSPWSNAAWEQVVRFTDAWRNRDWEGVLQHVGSNVEERTRHGRLAVVGEDATAALRGIFDFDAGSSWMNELVATRGERLVLYKATLAGVDRRSGGAFDNSNYYIGSLDEAGRPATLVIFDPDALDEALAELDRCYQYRLTPPSAIADPYNDRDWAHLRASLPADWQVRDHRSGGYETLTRESWVRLAEETSGLVPDVRMRIHHVRESGRAMLTLALLSGTREDGDFEIGVVSVSQFDTNLSPALVDMFDENQLDDARALFHELAASSDDDDFENAASRNGAQLARAVVARDWDAVSKLVNAEEYVIDDRRGFARVEMPGIDSIQSLVDVDDIEISSELLATRGDRLALARMRLLTVLDDGERSDGSVLTVQEVGEDDRAVLVAVFDLEDLDAAYAALDDRFIAQIGTEPEIVALARVYNSRDWEAMSRVGHPDIRTLDHRRLGLGSNSGHDAYDIARAGVDLAPDSRYVVDHLRYERRDGRGSAGLSLLRVVGQGDEWQFESEALVVARADRSRRFDVLEYFAVDDLASATARYDELVAELHLEPIGNLATVSGLKVLAAVEARDWDRITGCLAPDFAGTDMRGFAQLGGHGPEWFQELLSLDSFSGLHTVLATRGDRLEIGRLALRFQQGIGGDSEAEALLVTEVDVEGRITRMTAFDADGLDAAFDELDARYVAQGGADYSRFRKLRVARDRAGLIDMFEPEAMVDDHRSGGWGLVTAERDVELLLSTDALSDDARVFIRREIARAGSVLMLEQVHVGTTREGGIFELPHYTVTVSGRHGRIAHVDMFDLEAYDAARACFEAAVAAQAAH